MPEMLGQFVGQFDFVDLVFEFNACLIHLFALTVQSAPCATLDAQTVQPYLFPVESSATKVIGELRKTAWQRFARLQRTTVQLAQGRGQPKGVFRFVTNEDCNQWTANLNRLKK